MKSNADLIRGYADNQRFRGFSRNTIRRRAWTLQSMARLIEPRSLLDLTATDVVGFVGGRPAPQSRQALLMDVRGFFRWAVANDLTDVDPTSRIDTPRMPRREPTPLTAEEVHRVIEAAATPQVRLAIMLAAYAGLRVAEIAALHTDDLAHADRIVVRNGKGAKDRVIPLAPALAASLANYVEGRIGRVFTWRSPTSVSRVIRAALRAAGVSKRPHDLRAAFATEAARVSNGNLLLVGKMMGHTNLATTQRYVGWNPDGADTVAALYG